MKITDVSVSLNIPILTIIEFFNSKREDVNTYTPLNDYQLTIFMQNLESIKETAAGQIRYRGGQKDESTKISAQIPVLRSPKVVGKVDLSMLQKYQSTENVLSVGSDPIKSVDDQFKKFESNLEEIEDAEFKRMEIEEKQIDSSIDNILNLPKSASGHDVPDMEAVIMDAIMRGDGDVYGH